MPVFWGSCWSRNFVEQTIVLADVPLYNVQLVRKLNYYE